MTKTILTCDHCKKVVDPNNYVTMELNFTNAAIYDYVTGQRRKLITLLPKVDWCTTCLRELGVAKFGSWTNVLPEVPNIESVIRQMIEDAMPLRD